METFIETSHSVTKRRRYDLDWLRVIAFGLLILYHTGLYFNHWGYQVHNNVLSYGMDLPMVFLSQWRMPLLFMISGAGVYWSLAKRSPGEFISDRSVRILLPLVFGVLVIVPPQTYFTELTNGHSYTYSQFYTSFLTTTPTLDDPFPWHHLWYLAYIFTYSILSLPLCLYFKSTNGKRITSQWANHMNKPVWLIGLPIVWLMTGEILDLPENPLAFVGDWKNHFRYFSLFLFGYLLATQHQFWLAIVSYRQLTLLLGITLTLSLLYFYWMNWHEPENIEIVTFALLKTTNYWCWLLAIFGYAYKHLSFTNPFLKYAGPAVYPFYILHQTILIVIGYYLAHFDWYWPLKFSFLAFIMFGSCLLFYHFIIRPFRLMRLLFGVK